MDSAKDFLWQAAEIGLYVIMIFIGLGVIAAISKQLKPGSKSDQDKARAALKSFEQGAGGGPPGDESGPERD